MGGILQSLAENNGNAVAVTVAHICEVDTPRVAGMIKRLTRAIPGIAVQVARYGAKPFTADGPGKATYSGR